MGWVGHELDWLVRHPLTLLDNPDRGEARERDRIAFEGYVEGLRDAGWRGDARLARLGQVAREAILPTSIHVRHLLDEGNRAWMEPALGCSWEEWSDYYREKIRHPLFGYWEEEA
jgi:hypothetical protein